MPEGIQEPLGGLPNFDNNPQIAQGTGVLDNPVNTFINTFNQPSFDEMGLNDPGPDKGLLDTIEGLDPIQLQNLDEVIDRANGINPEQNTPPVTHQQGNQLPQNGTYIEQTFNHLKNALGEGFVPPENVTQETFLQSVFESLYPSFQQSLSPEAVSLNDYIRQGGDVNKWIESKQSIVDFKKLPTDDLLFSYYKEQLGITDENPDGLTDDEVRGYVNKKDPTEKKIEAMNVKNALIKEQEVAEREYAANSSIREAKEREDYKNELSASAKTTIAKIGNFTNIYGIPVNNQEITNFNAEFEKLILPDDTGVSPAQKILYDDVNLYKLLFIASKAGQTKNLVTDAQNRQIKEIKDNLNPNPPAFQSNTAWNAQNGPNLDDLARPAR